ncbi:MULTISPECIES: hypothetical protein [Pseudomonas]|uniref:hypothetical protein n=1 Tax=Pseudomonas TaxID=286 RepID=UPI0011B0070D|nr:hypothetical protein [Pseudomonas sp. MYb187]
MKRMMSRVFFVGVALASGAVQATGGNPKNNGNYDMDNEALTPRYVWDDGRLVSNPKYAEERRRAQERTSQVPRANDESTLYE